MRILYDITREVSEDSIPWPGEPNFTKIWHWQMEDGDSCNVSAFTMSPHTGTHVDAPSHFDPAGASAESLPLEAFVGPALLVDVSGVELIEPEHVPEEAGDIGRVIFKTGRPAEAGFDLPFAPLSELAARKVVEMGITLIGTDAPSVDAFESRDLVVHRILSHSGVCILENLLLTEVPTGRYWLLALPMKLRGLEASPVRAVLMGGEERHRL